MTLWYDILSAYPVLGRGRGKLALEKIKMAMAVQRKSWHWLETAKRCGLRGMPSTI